MTKEELKKEAQEQVNYHTPLYIEDFIHGYLAGAEPREKRIAELEQKLEQTEKDLADYQFNYPTIKELQKENAELKAQIENDRDLPAIAYMQGAEKQKKKDTDQLTKAKELLKQLVDIEYAVNIPKEKIISLRVKAEQFLNSEVEK